MSKNLQEFFKKVGKTPLLTKQQEVELSKRIEEGDLDARKLMINANMRLAISIAKTHVNQGCDLEDLIQESSLGLMKAVDRYDWRRGFKFSTYACWWIKQSVRQYVASQGGAIKLPAYAKNMLWKMKKIAEEYEEEFGVPPTRKEVAALLGTTESTLASFAACAANPLELDGQSYKKDDNSRSAHEILSVDDSAESVDEKIDRENLMKLVKDAMKNLTPREEAVLRLRFGINEQEEKIHANA